MSLLVTLGNRLSSSESICSPEETWPEDPKYTHKVSVIGENEIVPGLEFGEKAAAQMV